MSRSGRYVPLESFDLSRAHLAQDGEDEDEHASQIHTKSAPKRQDTDSRRIQPTYNTPSEAAPVSLSRLLVEWLGADRGWGVSQKQVQMQTLVDKAPGRGKRNSVGFDEDNDGDVDDEETGLWVHSQDEVMPDYRKLPVESDLLATENKSEEQSTREQSPSNDAAEWDGRVWRMIFFVISCGVVSEFVGYIVGLQPGRILGALIRSQESEIWMLICVGLGLTFLAAVCAAATQFATNCLVVALRARIGQRYVRRFFNSAAFGRWMDDYDQRLTQDADGFADSLAKMVASILLPVRAVVYIYLTSYRAGFFLTAGLVAHSLFGAFVAKALLAGPQKARREMQGAQGLLRGQMRRMRMFSVPIWISSISPQVIPVDASCESQLAKADPDADIFIAQKLLDNLLHYQYIWAQQFGLLDVWTKIIDYTGAIFNYMLIAIVVLYTGATNDMSPDEKATFIAQTSFVCIYLVYSCTQLVDLAALVAELFAYAGRLSALREQAYVYSQPNLADPAATNHNLGSSLSLLRTTDSDITEDLEASDTHTLHNDLLCFDNVDITTPQGTILIENINMSIKKQNNLLITGPNGCGKSSLVKAMAGLWNYNGRIIKPANTHGRKRIVFVPHQPYLLSRGTLRQQILYPESYSPHRKSAAWTYSDDILASLFGQVGLKDLLERMGGLDSWRGDWTDILSAGQQQRIAFARILLSPPECAVFDEATSAIDEEWETHLYTLAHELGITCITVGHRSSLRQVHQSVLEIRSDRSWLLRENTDCVWNTQALE